MSRVQNDFQRINQSSTDMMNLSVKRVKSGGKRRNYESVAQTVPITQQQSNNKRSTQTQMNFYSMSKQHPGQRTHSQQKKYMTNSGTKQKTSNQEMSELNPHSQAMNELIMIERIAKKRGFQNQTQDQQTSKTFEMSDPKYNSQLLNASGSKRRKQHANSGSINCCSIQNFTIRSKEKMKSKSSENYNQNNPQNIEELKRQILLKQALLESSGNSRRKSAGNSTLNSHSVSQTQLSQIGSQQQQQRKIQVPGVISYTQLQFQPQQQQIVIQGFNSQNSSQQVLIPQAQNNKLKLNTHQLIKKFLKERTESSQSSIQLNNSVVENYAGSASTLQPDMHSYKMQLSKKIMQQQQKLLGQQQPQRRKKDQYVTEPHPKRQSTPMLEMYEPPTINRAQHNQVLPQKQFISSKDKSETYAVAPSNNQGALNTFMKEYLTNVQWQQQQQHQQQDISNSSMREDSFIKQMKKKNPKKSTPKNVLAGSQFNWMM